MTNYKVVYDIKIIGAKWIDATSKESAAYNTIGFLKNDDFGAGYRLNRLLELLDLSVITVETEAESKKSKYEDLK